MNTKFEIRKYRIFCLSHGTSHLIRLDGPSVIPPWVLLSQKHGVKQCIKYFPVLKSAQPRFEAPGAASGKRLWKQRSTLDSRLSSKVLYACLLWKVNFSSNIFDNCLSLAYQRRPYLLTYDVGFPQSLSIRPHCFDLVFFLLGNYTRSWFKK